MTKEVGASNDLKLTDKVDKLINMVDEIRQQVNQQKEFLANLSPHFLRNIHYSANSEYGLEQPKTSFEIDNQHFECPKKEPYPHLYHTFNPQLNNITDMLGVLLEKEKQDLELISIRDKLKQKLAELEREKPISTEKLKEALEQLEIERKHKCITLEDLEKLLEKTKTKEIVPVRSYPSIRIDPPML